MNWGPRQIIGLVALIGFGSILVWDITTPKRDPFSVPGAMKLDDSTLPLPDAVPPAADAIAALPVDPLAIGPDDAKDDLYCSGLIYAAHRASADPTSPEAEARRNNVIALAEAGTGKLIAAGAADKTQSTAIADAHAAKAQSDFTNAAPRITLDACTARAAALVASP